MLWFTVNTTGKFRLSSFSQPSNVPLSYAMYAFWALVVSVSIFNQLVHILTSLRRDGPLIDAEGVMPRQAARKVTAFGRVLHLLRQHLTVPATFGHKRAQPIGWCTVPTRIQSLTIGLFVLLNVVLSLVDYPIFDGNMMWVSSFLSLNSCSDTASAMSQRNFNWLSISVIGLGSCA